MTGDIVASQTRIAMTVAESLADAAIMEQILPNAVIGAVICLIPRLKNDNQRAPMEPKDKQSSRARAELEGRYTNYFQVGHNAFEFLMEFGQLYSDGEGQHIHTRLVTNPTYAVAFLELLQQ